MRVVMKIYKNFDPELYALCSYGVKLHELFRFALEKYARGEYVSIHIPESMDYSLVGKKRYFSLAFEVTDETSINFLKNNIKDRNRTAFLKSLLKWSITAPQLGMFFKNIEAHNFDSEMIKSKDIKNLPNLVEITLSEQDKKKYLIEDKDFDEIIDSLPGKKEIKENAKKRAKAKQQNKKQEDKKPTENNTIKAQTGTPELEDKFGITVSKNDSEIDDDEIIVLQTEDEDDEVDAPEVTPESNNKSNLKTFDGFLNLMQ